MSVRLAHAKPRTRRSERLGYKSPAQKGFPKLLTAICWILCVLGLLFFPAAFVGSLWSVPAATAIGGVAWFWMEGRNTCSKELAILLVILAAYFAPSVIPCRMGYGFCEQWIVDQEVYLLAVGLLLCACGYVTASRPSRTYAYAFWAALSLFVAIAVVVLITRDSLTPDIEPPLAPLFIERNDLAPLVAWMFFVFGAFRNLMASAWVRNLALLIVLAVASLLSLATQSRLVAVISILGAVFFIRIGGRGASRWIFLGVLVVCLLAVEYRSIESLVRRVILAEGGESVFTRFYLWKIGWEMFLTAPWLGHGLGGFGGLFEMYRNNGYAAAGLDARFISWPHNVPIEVLVEKGIAGLVAYSILLALVISNLIRRAREDLKDMRTAVIFLFLALSILGFLDSTTKRLWYLPSLLYVLGVSEGLRRNAPP